jgi:DNA-binding MarR family transcriptional regulator
MRRSPRKSPRANDDLADGVLRALRRILRRTSEQARQFSRASGLTVAQALCLRAIAEAPGDEVTAAQVGQLVQLSPPTVSRLLDRLEQDGLITRERRSRDRRKVCLVLTREGRKRLKNLPTPLQDALVERFANLPKKEQTQLLASLERLVELMEAGEFDAAPMLEPGIDVKPRST